MEGLEGMRTVTAVNEDPSVDVTIMNVVIRDNDLLQNFDGLGHIENQFNILIESNATLPNLNGLQNQDSIHVLIVKNNNALVNMAGLQDSSSITLFIIEDNDSLIYLDTLDNLTHVEELFVKNNSNLKDLSSLPNYTTIVTLYDNDKLVDLSAFVGLTGINTPNINIWDNDTLSSLLPLQEMTSLVSLDISTSKSIINLTGLENLHQLQSQLVLWNNENLSDITALHQLGEAKELYIRSNPSLTSLIGFAQDTAHFKNVTIKDNLNLPVCEAASICHFLQNFSIEENTVEINNNMSGCNSRTEVETACMIIGTKNIITSAKFLQINPNPAFTHFNIQFLKQNQSKIENIQVFDALGQLVYVAKGNHLSPKVEVADWAKGLYVVLVNGRFVEKVLVE